MKFNDLLTINLHLFDGEGGGDSGTAAQGETNGAVPGVTRRGKSGEFANVVFGKQESTAVAEPVKEAHTPAAEETEVQSTSNTLEDRRKAYRDMVNGEMKDIYAEDIQRIINRRFKEVHPMETQLKEQQPIMDLLKQRYNVDDASKLMSALESDNAYWNAAAEEAGMNVEQYKEFQKMKRDNAALLAAEEGRRQSEAQQAQTQKWLDESFALKEKFPAFDLATELQNPHFQSMLKSGTPMEHAYKVMHFDELMQGVVQTTTASTEKRIIDNVRARGSRPAENGTVSQSAFTVKDDVSKLTKAERAEIARQTMRGKKIEF